VQNRSIERSSQPVFFLFVADMREKVPDFYGYVPSNALLRSVVFATMLLISALLLVTRCLTIVIFSLIGGRDLVFAFIGTDLALYLLIKANRGDFWYWVPAGGSLEVLTSILFRGKLKKGGTWFCENPFLTQELYFSCCQDCCRLHLSCTIQTSQ